MESAYFFMRKILDADFRTVYLRRPRHMHLKTFFKKNRIAASASGLSVHNKYDCNTLY